jgi:hypothetical protein
MVSRFTEECLHALGRAVCAVARYLCHNLLVHAQLAPAPHPSHTSPSRHPPPPVQALESQVDSLERQLADTQQGLQVRTAQLRGAEGEIERLEEEGQALHRWVGARQAKGRGGMDGARRR